MPDHHPLRVAVEVWAPDLPTWCWWPLRRRVPTAGHSSTGSTSSGSTQLGSSAALRIEPLGRSGDLTSAYDGAVDPTIPAGPVPMFGPGPGETSPSWQAIAREYVERWAHQSQIRRAPGQPSLTESPFLDVGMPIVATVGDAPRHRAHGGWR